MSINGNVSLVVEDLCDCVSLVFYCPSDCTILLTQDGVSNEYWIPSVKVHAGFSWMNKLKQAVIQDFFGDSSLALSRVLRFVKLWVPNHKFPYLHHLVFEVLVNTDQKRKCRTTFGKVRGKIRWSPEEDLIKFYNGNNLRSPEVLDFFCQSKRNTNYIQNVPAEHTICGNFMEITENALVLGKSSAYEQIVDAAGIDKGAQEILYRQFLCLCYPCNYMSLNTFGRIVPELGWGTDQMVHLFRSADAYGRGAISFREFVYFLAAVEPGRSLGGAMAELRCRYIFRYLDTDRNSLLRRDELKQFVTLVRKTRKQSLEGPKVEKDLQDTYKTLGYQDTHGITMSEFLKGVGELKIRGTSQIYTSPISIHKLVKDMLAREKQIAANDPRSLFGANGAVPTVRILYDLAVHTVRIHKNGMALNVNKLYTFEKDNGKLLDAVTFSSTRQPAINEAARRTSVDQFSQTSQSNELLKALRYLNQMNKKQNCYLRIEQMSHTWGQLEPTLVAKHIIAVCQQVKQLFMKEKRMLEITSPVYIVGDLHGNFSDLLYFEKILWHVGPGLCPSNLLFLGDYVDRGLFSVEVVAYLFCYKVQTPHKLTLLRGNHEIRKVQQQWTFEKECKLKFGDLMGGHIFNTINDAFDSMPLAATIDGQIFCCHGGIPPPWLCPNVSAINEIPVILNDPQDQSALAWELMWNDPVRSKLLTERTAMELLANEGFAINTRRGTAHVFNVDALEKFLAANGFSHIIRAHEVAEAGFSVQQRGKLLTVFSSSRYCGGENEAACILADQGKLRILRLETE